MSRGKVELTANTDVVRLADGPDLAPGTWQLVVPISVHQPTKNGRKTTHLIAGPFKYQYCPTDPVHRGPPGPATPKAVC